MYLQLCFTAANSGGGGNNAVGQIEIAAYVMDKLLETSCTNNLFPSCVQENQWSETTETQVLKKCLC